MGQQASNPCCGRDRMERESPSMPLRRITALQDAKVHFINEAPMMCILRERLWESREGSYVVRDINGISLFQVDGILTSTRRLCLPSNGGCHATVERGAAEDEWHIFVGDERRVTVLKRIVSNQPVFLVHVLPDPVPSRGAAAPLPLPTLSVRGNFGLLDFWMFDCSDPATRKVAHASRGIPASAALQADKATYTLEVICIALVIDDAYSQGKGFGGDV